MYLVYPENQPDDTRDYEVDSVWLAATRWLEDHSEEELEDLKGQNIVAEDNENDVRVVFTVVKQNDEYLAKRTDGEKWRQEAQTFHIGLSVYGPNGSGKFRGAISVDSEGAHGETYDDFATAQTKTVAALRELLADAATLEKLLSPQAEAAEAEEA